MNELIKNALIENIYMMQGIDITSIHECKWIVSEQNYDMHIIHHSTKTYPRMKQMRIKIQLEFHQEIADITLLCPFIFPLNLEICCVTSLVNRPAELHKARPWPAPSPRRHVYPSPSCGNCQLPVVDPARGGFWCCWVTLRRPGDSDLVEWHAVCALYGSLHLNRPGPGHCPAAACFSIGLRSGATLPLRKTAVLRTWAIRRSMWRPGPAMSWPAGGERGPQPDVRHQPPGDTQATANVDK